MRLADRGYDAGWIRTLGNEQGTFTSHRNAIVGNRSALVLIAIVRATLIERFCNKIKHCRRIDTTTGAQDAGPSCLL
jgi:hypothetical protein